MKTSRWKRTAAIIGALSAVLLSLYYYTTGLLYSPAFNEQPAREKKFIREYIVRNDKNSQQEKLLADAYWLRYEDVRKSSYWGTTGPMGIWGPRDHYQQNGKREGRIFAPFYQPENLALEAKLAEEYWRLYPDVRTHSIWGKESSLGILGPRDHYRYRGRFQKRIWPSLKIEN